MPEYISQIRKKCEYYFEKNCIEYNVVEFLSGEEVLEYNGHIDIIFLDIEMNEGIDGIETMERLLKHDNVWKIVFVTNHDERFKFTYGLKTLGYISKPAEYSDVEKWLNVAVDELIGSKILASGNIKYWEEQIRQTPLIRIHKSYIVNMEYVSTRRSDHVIMENYSEEIPIGRGYRTEFREHFVRYMDKKIDNRI